MKPVKINSRKLVEIYLKELKFSDKSEVHHILFSQPESVAILPIFDKDKVIMVKQFRYAINEYSWEIPAGGIQEKESPEKAAMRELFEETGYKTSEINYVCSFYLSNSISDEKMNLYEARDLLKHETHAYSELLETDIQIKIFEANELQNMLDNNIITDATTIIAIQHFLAK